MKKNKKIAAVVVTYNRARLLIKCLDALLKQTYPLDSIILIDNASTDNTPEFLKKNSYLDNPIIDYQRQSKNSGGAGGFYEGVKRGCKKYDWLLILDDDARVDSTYLENLLHGYKKIKKETEDNPVALVGARFSPGGQLIKYDSKKINLSNPLRNLTPRHITINDLDKKYFKTASATFEGILVTTQAIKNIGFPDKRFFIFGDDTDYCIRLLRRGKIYFVPSARLTRMREVIKSKEYDWKKYYEIRNLFYLDLKYTPFYIKTIRISINLIRLIFNRITNNDLSNISLIFRSLKDSYKMYREEYDYFK